MRKWTILSSILLGSQIFWAPPAFADDLYRNSNWANMATDTKASQIGDVISVVVFQNTEARNSARNSTEKKSRIDGDISASGLSKFGNISFGSGYSGRGEVLRSESLTTRISVEIVSVFPNGDYLIAGQQMMQVNGEDTIIGIRGKVRPQDITHDNQILSTKISNAEISYDGSGFVSKGAKPGLFNWLFSVFGLGI